MFLTTLCYIEKDDCYLMLHRVKKENDLNHDKWIGVGGKFEAGEMPEECMLREVKEETGLTLTSYRARGVITFISNEWGIEYMHLFTADQMCIRDRLKRLSSMIKTFFLSGSVRSRMS